ncbi:MAG TPA: PKD domain-containing protein [Planctomycetota bacterium]|nr:PKD domain-containing protein [Planctomycetota bacterium]
MNARSALKLPLALLTVLALSQLAHAENMAPVANAGADQTVKSDETGTATVTLDGSASSDADGGTLSFAWSWTEGTETKTATGPGPAVTLPVGTTEITLTVTDGQGGSATDSVLITVEDGTGPEVTGLKASPDVLWPPNHKMVEVTISAEATDNSGTETTLKIVSVESNEAENGEGDGNTAPDWEITGDLTVNLRAERAGPGSGREYTITVEATDASGNVTTSTVIVKVPHDQGNDDDDDDGLCITAGDFLTHTQSSWGAPAEGDNAGAYLAANFATAFPTGLKIGAGAAGLSGNSATFTTAAAIEAFLPQSGAPAALAVEHTDPLTTEAGILAGQVVALTLNTVFDETDAEFSKSPTLLKDLVFNKEGSGCDGMTVAKVLETANTILGGGTSTVTLQDITDCVTLINENFDNAEINGGLLSDPNCALTEEEVGEVAGALKQKSGRVYNKLMTKFDKDKDGKLKGKEKSDLRKFVAGEKKKIKEKQKKEKKAKKNK